jgi:dihydrofolate synthase/folylpolyglutamate synthase
MLRNKGYSISDDDIIAGMASVSWPGRFEILGREPVFILDGAHNPQGMEVTAESLNRHFGTRKIVFIVGVMADKDIDSMIAFIVPLAEAFITVKPDYPRALCSAELAGRLSRYGVPVIDCGTVEEGVSKAHGIAGESGIVCALGSLYLSAEVRTAYNIYYGLEDRSI